MTASRGLRKTLRRTTPAKPVDWRSLAHYYTVYPHQDGGWNYKVWVVDEKGKSHIECHRIQTYDAPSLARAAAERWLEDNGVVASYSPTFQKVAV